MHVTSLLMVVLALFVSDAAFAHGPEGRQGKPVEGSVTAVSKDSFTVETENGKVEVTRTEKTEIGIHKKADWATIKPGVHVMVSGHKLPGGGLAAEEVMVHAPESESSGEHPHH